MSQVDPPYIPTAEELYDQLMRQVDEDLLTTNLTGLKEKYTNESKEEKQERGRRYRKAFEKYDQMYRDYMTDLHSKVIAYRKHALESVEEEDRQKEENKVAELEGMIDQLESANFPLPA